MIDNRFELRTRLRTWLFILSAEALIVGLLLWFGISFGQPVSEILPPLAALAAITVFGAAHRPFIVAEPWGITIRPSFFGTYRLPWGTIAQIAGFSLPGGLGYSPFLLLRIDREQVRGQGIRVSWADRILPGVVNRRAAGELAGYDLALNMRNFRVPPSRQLAALREHVPDSVTVTDCLALPGTERRER